MIPRLKKLLKQHDVTTLGELSKKLKVSLSVLKNISSNRTAFSSLSRRRTQHRVFPKQSENLAELIGVVLGDGNIFACRRCQRLTMMSLGYSPQVSNRYVRLARKDQVYRFIAEMDFERPFPSLKTGKA